MKKENNAQLITEIMLQVFHLNGTVLKMGDSLTREFGLTSSRWQVLGAIIEEPLTVADIARVRGIERQSVQRTVNSLAEENLISFIENPRHKKAKLIQMTKSGKEKYEKVMHVYNNVAAELGKLFSGKDLTSFLMFLKKFDEAITTI